MTDEHIEGLRDFYERDEKKKRIKPFQRNRKEPQLDCFERRDENAT